MFAVVAGGGKAGRSLSRMLMERNHEVVLIEMNRRRYRRLNEELEHAVIMGDATEIYILERAGVERADVVVAVTGDDEDNVIICQVAKEKFGVQKAIARVNNPENQEVFDVLGVGPTVCSTTALLSLIEHQMPVHKLVRLLDLKQENLEIVEVLLEEGSALQGKRVDEASMPSGVLLISILREGKATIPSGPTVLEAGDNILAILEPGKEEELAGMFQNK